MTTVIMWVDCFSCGNRTNPSYKHCEKYGKLLPVPRTNTDIIVQYSMIREHLESMHDKGKRLHGWQFCPYCGKSL